MKITITYEYEPTNPAFPYWARVQSPDASEVDFKCCGETWEDARTRAIARAKLLAGKLGEPVPFPEEIDLDGIINLQ